MNYKLLITVGIVTMLFVGCGGSDDGDDPVESVENGIAGLTMGNYPRVDGSTSTDPLNYIVVPLEKGLSLIL